MDAVGFNVGFHFEHSNIILFNHQAIEMEAIKKSISSSVSFNVCAYGNIFCNINAITGAAPANCLYDVKFNGISFIRLYSGAVYDVKEDFSGASAFILNWPS